MSTATTSTAGTTTGVTPAGRVLALASTEVQLILRNRTVAVSSIVVPLALGVFWAFTFNSGGDPAMQAVVVALQLAVALGMGVYVTATQTVVARRHASVLKRLRTSGLSDGGLLAATVAPSVVLGLFQLLVFAAINVATGAPPPMDYLPLALAVVGGLALVVTAALATSVVTPSPERSQITTLPLTFVLLGSGIFLAIADLANWWQAFLLVPGGAIGQLSKLALEGSTWAPGLAGLPAVLPSIVAIVVWPIVFGMLAMRRFRWDSRH
jgi:ABC-2 type transport system permease protein